MACDCSGDDTHTHPHTHTHTHTHVCATPRHTTLCLQRSAAPPYVASVFLN